LNSLDKTFVTSEDETGWAPELIRLFFIKKACPFQEYNIIYWLSNAWVVVTYTN